MAKINKVVITLLGNEHLGRYKIKYQEYEIEEELDKTVRVIEKGNKVRRLKKDFMKVKSDFKNDRIDKLQFTTICYESDREEAVKLLSLAVKSKAEKLMTSADNAWQAFVKGTELEKIES